MKKRILAILIFVFAVFLCGCEVAPQYTLVLKSNGSVTQMFYIPFSSKELHDNGVDNDTIAEIATETKGKFEYELAVMRAKFVNKLENDSGLSEDQKDSILEGCPKQNDLRGSGDVNGISFQLNFASQIHYYYFITRYDYNQLLEKLNEDTCVTKEGIFINRIISTSNTIFGVQYNETQTRAQYLTSECEKTLREKTSLTDEQINNIIPKTYIYRYGTTNKKWYSDANRVRNIDGIYYHEWDISVNDSDKEINFWRVTINRNAWYATILGSSFVLIAILFIVAKVKDKKTKVDMVNQ